MSEMGRINAFFGNFSELMAAAGFAEEGEHKMARQMLEEAGGNHNKPMVPRKGINKVKLSAR
jgi:hypothetical protein